MAKQVVYSCDICKTASEPISAPSKDEFGNANALPPGWIFVSVESSLKALPDALHRVVDAAYQLPKNAAAPFLEMLSLQAQPVSFTIVVCADCTERNVGSFIPRELETQTAGLVEKVKKDMRASLTLLEPPAPPSFDGEDWEPVFEADLPHEVE